MADSNRPDGRQPGPNPPGKGPGGKNRLPQPPGGMKFSRGVFGWVLFIGVAIVLFLLISSGNNTRQKIEYSQFITQLKNENVAEVTLSTDQAFGKLREPTDFGTNTGPTQEFYAVLAQGLTSDPAFVELVRTAAPDTPVSMENSNNLLFNIIAPLIPWLLIFAFIWFFVFRQLRNSAGGGGMLGNFGRSRHRITNKEHTNVTFNDVAGVQEAKDEVGEIVEFLKNPKKFQRLGGRIPRGVLLVGEPGTGKTLLAKAIAGEADVPFFSISGSDFVEMFVGVGASRVRDLFKQAKENAPCIIFLDEIDAVGRRRGSGFSSGGHDEREQTLNAILVEMDGFETNDQVIVIASTNRVDVLDPALTRPGRFDRQVYVPLPDVKGRMEILKVHARKVKLGTDVDLLRLARATPGFSGADLAAVINESALGATLSGKDFIEQEDLEEARDKVRFGRAKKSRVIDEKDKVATAYHEAGHAVVQWLEKDADPIHKVTIIPRGNYGGATMALPERDRNSYSQKWCVAFMKVCFAGRLAEEMFTGDINTGAMGDIRQATGIARKMIREWGMSDRVGFIYFGDEEKQNMFDAQREYSDETARVIDEEVKQLIDRLYEETRTLLDGQRDAVERLAKALMKYETLTAPEVDKIMRGEPLTKPTVGDLLEQETRKKNATDIQPGPTNAEPDVGLGGGPLPSPG
ncbi:MAG: ATP-dependent zinc metalloprotease FtsH [Phycisphaerae bacterium]